MANTQFIEETYSEDLPSRAQLQEENRELREEFTGYLDKRESIRRTSQLWKGQADYLAKQLKEAKDKAEVYRDQVKAYRKMYTEAKKQLNPVQKGREIWRNAAREVLNEEEKKDNEINCLKDTLRRVHATIRGGTHVRERTALSLIESCIDIDEEQ